MKEKAHMDTGSVDLCPDARHFILPANEDVSKSDQDGTNFFMKEFESFVLQDGYPCIGAQAAINGKSYAIGLFDKMNSLETPELLGLGLDEYIDETWKRSSDFMTYVAIFRNDTFGTEESYEQSLWSLLNRLHAIDAKKNNWSDNVGHNPDETDFSFSFKGRAFFMVGLHPQSSRKARRFGYTAIAFNLHEQFENLRKKGRYQKIKQVIRENELEFSGSINPMLEDFGEGLEAPQYSGRKVSTDWECPFAYKGKE